MKPMKIALLGATGNIGQRLLEQALAVGHDVVAYVRDTATVQPRDHLTLIEGSLDDLPALTAALSGVDVVVCSIAPRTAMSAARKPTDFMQTLLPGILTAVKEVDARLVLVSAFGVGQSVDKASSLARFAYRTLTKGLFEDKRRSEILLPTSGIDWTVVLPVNLNNAKPLDAVTVKDIDTVTKVPGLPTLPFANAAAGILQIATDPSTSGKHLLITTPTGWK
jgi:uncharacterized protein YbjT (DUF2867 family)